MFQWEFNNQDKNKNGILDGDEINTMLIPDEDCMVGFMKSCDYDHQPGISRVEWSTCFPPVVPGEWRRAASFLQNAEKKIRTWKKGCKSEWQWATDLGKWIISHSARGIRFWFPPHMWGKSWAKFLARQLAQPYPLVCGEFSVRNSPREAVGKIQNLFDIFCLARQIHCVRQSWESGWARLIYHPIQLHGLLTWRKSLDFKIAAGSVASEVLHVYVLLLY